MHGEPSIHCGVEYGNLKIWVHWIMLKKALLVQHALSRLPQMQCQIHGVECIVQGMTSMLCCGCGGEM